MDIEEVAAKTPEKIHKVFIDPERDSRTRRSTASRRKSAFRRERAAGACHLKGLYKAFDETDCQPRRNQSAHPLPATARWLRLDAKINFE